MIKYSPHDIEEILSHYSLKGIYTGYDLIKNGHINDTYIIRYVYDGKDRWYVLQRINTDVFKKPNELMDNYVKVTNFIRSKVVESGGDRKRESVRVYETTDGQPYYTDKNGYSWRVINYIIDTETYNNPDTPEVCRKAGEAFGEFMKMLADYPSDTLYETIPNFHNTISRFDDFNSAVERNASGRAKNAQREIDFIRKRKDDCGVLVNLLKRGELPLRVTHNDTKLNNILFDKKTGKGICVIDLDTVMPGLSLYDFGDSLRFAGSTGAEDEKNLDKVWFDVNVYRSYTEGYLKAAGDSLTPNEVYYLPFSVKLMSLECGMRFLADYIDGDVYFKTEYPEHNLDRCRTQLKLVEDIESKYNELLDLTQNLYSRLMEGN